MAEHGDLVQTYSRLHTIETLRKLIFPSYLQDAQTKHVKIPTPQTLSESQSLQGKEFASLEDYLEGMKIAAVWQNMAELEMLVAEVQKNWGFALPPVGQKRLNDTLSGFQGIKSEKVFWFADRLRILFEETGLRNRIRSLGEIREPIPMKESRPLYLPELLTVGYYKSTGEGECTLDVLLGAGGGGSAKSVDLANHKNLKVVEIDDVADAADKDGISASKRSVLQQLDGRPIATHSAPFRSGLAILADGVAAAWSKDRPPDTGYYLYVASFGSQAAKEFPIFHYDQKSTSPFPYIEMDDIDPFLVFDGNLLKERRLFSSHGYKAIDGKTLTADETVIGMWWPPKFRPYLIDWMGKLGPKVQDSIIGPRTPEEFFFEVPIQAQ